MKWRCKGTSLIEFMISMTLGLMVVGSALYVFSGSKQSFRSADAKSRIQENARYAKFILSSDIRMAGFQGCPNLSLVQPTNDLASPGDNQTLTNNNAILGYEGSSGGSFSPALPSWLTSNIAGGTSIVPGSDVIVTRKASSIGSNLTSNMGNTTSDISVGGRLSIASGDILIISDCQSSDIFQATAGSSNTTIKHSAALSKAYQTDAKVYKLQVYAFYLKASGRTNQAGQPVYALYRQNIAGTEEELFDGVENMKITYGQDSNSDITADTYESASAIATSDWANVITVNLDLLFSSIENVSEKSTSYTYQGTTITPTDRVLRKEWDTFVTLRNRTT